MAIGEEKLLPHRYRFYRQRDQKIFRQFTFYAANQRAADKLAKAYATRKRYKRVKRMKVIG